MHNNWSEMPAPVGLVAFGIGQGSLVALVSNVLVTASPKELAVDVGSLRGATQNLASAVAGALLVGLLSGSVLRSLADNPLLPPALQPQVDLDNITFISNDHLQEFLAGTSATPELLAEAIRVNIDGRLRTLKMEILIMALLSIIPAAWLPRYPPGEPATAESPHGGSDGAP